MLAVHIEHGRVSIRRKARPRRPRGYALIRTLCAGICNTDLELQRGYYDFRGTPGHEFVGEVVDCESRDLEGKRVVGEINLACGRCKWCRCGLGRHCPRRAVLGIVRHPGAFAEYFVLPEANLHVVPASLAIEEAVFTEPLAAACEILDQVHIPKDRPVAVLGDGKLGLLVAQVLRATGSQVCLYGHHRAKMRLVENARIRTGMAPKNAAARFPLVVEATGSAAGLALAARMVLPRGTIVMKSTTHRETALDTAGLIVNEVTLVGSRCGRFEPALRLLRSQKVDVLPLISARLPLAEARRGFELAAAGALKVLLYPQARGAHHSSGAVKKWSAFRET